MPQRRAPSFPDRRIAPDRCSLQSLPQMFVHFKCFPQQQEHLASLVQFPKVVVRELSIILAELAQVETAGQRLAGMVFLPQNTIGAKLAELIDIRSTTGLPVEKAERVAV